ncbi:MAG: ethanolamine ammonia-lyase subunit EutC [Flavihumibacter sp.]
MLNDKSITPGGPPADPWSALRQLTAARIALGRTGVSEPLQHSLAFRLAHAHARDAVYASLNVAGLQEGLSTLFPAVPDLCSQAVTRDQYLQFPDAGRRLSEASRVQLLSLSGDIVTNNGNLAAFAGKAAHRQRDNPLIAVIIADGLSARAVNEHAVPLLQQLRQRLPALSSAACCLVRNGRVAIGDPIGEALHATLSLVLIGERPGLSSPDSMGVYITYQPAIGRTDADRNCVSNIRPGGLPVTDAAGQIQSLVSEILFRRLSGVSVKAGIHQIGGHAG